MNGSTPLAQTLTRLLEEQGITAKDLAEKSQVPRSTIGGWKLGVHPHDLNDVRKVAHALGCSFEYLVFGKDEQNLSRLVNSATITGTVEGVYRIKIERISGSGPNGS